jgi:tetratricopeptide (TPR) repeat protein
MSPEEQAKQHCERGDQLAWIERKTTAALKEYRAALKIWPSCAAAHWRIGQIHFFARKRRLEEALQEFQETIRIAPEWSEGHLWCANTLADLQRAEEAITEYRETIRLEPNDPRHYISLGVCLSKVGRHAEAVNAFGKGIELKPAYGEIAAHMMLADALQANGQLREALHEWRLVANMKAVWDYEQGEPERAQVLLAQNEKAFL